MDLLFENFELLADAPNGVQKLRELILQLAVQGKLTAEWRKRHPERVEGSHSASVLLEKIKLEKEKLISEGKIKKQKPLPPIGDDEKPYDLPQGWEWVTLQGIGTINPRNYIDDELDVSFSPMTLVPFEYDKSISFEIRKWKELKSGFTHFKENDVLVAKITPSFENGKSVVAKSLKNSYGAGTTELHVFRGNPHFILPEYVFIYFKSPKFIEVGALNMTGTAGQQRVPKTYVAENPFPLPPFYEQIRIVAKVDQLMALCDELEKQKERRAKKRARINKAATHLLLESKEQSEFNANWRRIQDNFELLYEVPENVAQLKQAILQLAVQGKLVSQNPDDEPASILLEKIKSEKERLIAEGKLKAGKPLPPIGEDEKPYALPQGWEWVRLVEITSKITDGEHINPIGRREGVPILSAKNLGDKVLNFNGCRFVSPDDAVKFWLRCRPENGDILTVSRGGGVGRTIISYSNIDYCLMGSVLLFKPSREISNYYLYYYLNSIIGQKRLIQSSGSTAQPAIYIIHLKRNFFIPLPPFEEQKRIVAKVDALMHLCDGLETGLSKSQQTAGRLMNAVAQGVMRA